MNKVILVDWDDAQTVQSWHEGKKENLHCRTIGFVVYEDNTQIEIAGSIADDDLCNNSIIIPKRMITKCEKIKLK